MRASLQVKECCLVTGKGIGIDREGRTPHSDLLVEISMSSARLIACEIDIGDRMAKTAAPLFGRMVLRGVGAARSSSIIANAVDSRVPLAGLASSRVNSA